MGFFGFFLQSVRDFFRVIYPSRRTVAALRWECGSALLSLTASADFGHFGILWMKGSDVPSMEIG